MNPIERHHMFKNIDREEAERLLLSRSVYGPIFRKSNVIHNYAISFFTPFGSINHTLLTLLPNNRIQVADTQVSVDELYLEVRNYNPGAYAAPPLPPSTLPAAAAMNNNENPKPFVHKPRKNNYGNPTPFVHEPRSAAPRKSRRSTRRSRRDTRRRLNRRS